MQTLTQSKVGDNLTWGLESVPLSVEGSTSFQITLTEHAMTDLEKTKLYYKKTQLFEFLYKKCQEDRDLLADTIDQYISSLSDEKLNELEDLLVNNFEDL